MALELCHKVCPGQRVAEHVKQYIFEGFSMPFFRKIVIVK